MLAISLEPKLLTAVRVRGYWVMGIKVEGHRSSKNITCVLLFLYREASSGCYKFLPDHHPRKVPQMMLA
jgi:hypothetical protein